MIDFFERIINFMESMIDFIVSLIKNLYALIVSVPKALVAISSTLNLLPPFITVPLMVFVSLSLIIAILNKWG